MICFNNMNSLPKKIAIYIDGNNFYFSVKRAFNCKIDIEKFCKKLADKNNLIKINYYTANVEQKNNPKVYAEQQKFFEALRKIDKFTIIFGRLEKHKEKGVIYYVEKASDINLALDLVLDAQSDIYDIAYLVSNDGDFSGAVSAAINKFGKKIIYVAVGNRNPKISYHLKKVASEMLKIDKDFIENIKL